MAAVTISDGALQIDLTVPERVLSLHSPSVVVPLTQIRGARAVSDVLSHVRGVRQPGAGLPGMLAIGTWRGTLDGRDFHDFVLIHRPGPGIVLTTSGAYDRLLLADDEPERLIADLGIAS